MKQKILLVTIIIAIFISTSYSQIRVHSDGDVSIGTYSDYGQTLNINSYDKGGLYSRVYHSSEWKQNIVSDVYKNTTCSYVVHSRYSNSDVFYVRGDGYAAAYGGFYTFSDKKLKTNINTIGDPMEKIMRLRGVTYNLLSDLTSESTKNSKKLNYGLIAQEVEEIVPEVVETMHDSIKTISYEKLVPLLIEGIKQQQEHISDLEKKIESLNSMLTHNEINTEDKNSYNYPNPFNTSTQIDLTIPNKVVKASLNIMDSNGRLIKCIHITDRGKSTITLKASEFTSGVYTYALIADGIILNENKMIIKK